MPLGAVMGAGLCAMVWVHSVQAALPLLLAILAMTSSYAPALQAKLRLDTVLVLLGMLIVGSPQKTENKAR
jgi:MFS transporter, LPLT family, lysophospholipid transporter